MPVDFAKLHNQFKNLPKTPAQLPRCVVAYLDILGWAELTRSGEDARILAALAFVQIGNSEVFGKLLPAVKSVGSTTFSDTIVFWSDPTPEQAGALALKVQLVCLALLTMGHYLRGGIAVGPLLHLEGTLAGDALIDAYRLESTVASYPRILVSDEAAPLLSHSPRAGQSDRRPQTSIDADGLVFLEPLAAELGGARIKPIHDVAVGLRQSVAENFEDTKKPQRDQAVALNRRGKYGWMLRYLDGVIAAPIVD